MIFNNTLSIFYQSPQIYAKLYYDRKHKKITIFVEGGKDEFFTRYFVGFVNFYFSIINRHRTFKQLKYFTNIITCFKLKQ